MPMQLDQNGFSLMEILTVMVMIGIIASFAIPKFGSTLDHQSVRGAASEIATFHSKARNSAISRGRRTAFAIKSGVLAIRSLNPVTGVSELVGGTTDSVVGKFGVTMTVNPSTRDTLVFDSRGLGTEGSQTTIYVSKSGFTDTITISSLGRIQH
jgi:prepilin-type N-terminal cleavage/methylation domain-containing protein